MKKDFIYPPEKLQALYGSSFQDCEVLVGEEGNRRGRNSKGEIITVPNQYRKKKFYHKSSITGGRPVTEWDQFAKDSTSQATHKQYSGFHLKTKFPNGLPYQTKVLQPGDLIIRYGFPGGNYTAPYKTRFEELSLPYKEESMPYNIYEVQHPVLVDLIVQEGKAAPNFEHPGLGIQYYHDQSIITLLREKALGKVVKKSG
ncbi:MAG: TNT domain-containing protein [Erysipelotrichaceae bacterium]|nr:TNT domain-containing protein [Erysipelotrichaceae bacterium]